MRLEHHLVGGYVRYISPHIIIIIIIIIIIFPQSNLTKVAAAFKERVLQTCTAYMCGQSTRAQKTHLHRMIEKAKLKYLAVEGAPPWYDNYVTFLRYTPLLCPVGWKDTQLVISITESSFPLIFGLLLVHCSFSRRTKVNYFQISNFPSNEIGHGKIYFSEQVNLWRGVINYFLSPWSKFAPVDCLSMMRSMIL